MKRRTFSVVAAGAITALLAAVLPQAAATAATGANCKLNTKLAQAQCDAVTMGILNKVVTFDDTKRSTVSDYQVNYPQQGLLWRFDENLVPRMDLLAKQDVTKDGKTIFQELKPGLKYSDGTPVTAEDVVASYDRVKKSGTSPFLGSVDSVVALSPTSIRWNLNQPWPDANWVMASNALFINPAGRQSQASYWDNPVSAGPMKLVSWDKGTGTIVQQVNPNYWAKPKVTQITYVSIPDAATRKLALQSGQVDYVFDLGYQGVQDLDKNTIRWFAQPLPGTYTLTVHTTSTTNPALQKAKNRQAISAAMDRAKVAKVAFFGTVLPSCAQTFIKGNPYHQCALPNDGKQDLALAKKLLAEAGNPNGFSFDMIVWARPGWPEAGLIIKEDLAKVGITANVTVKDAVAAQADLQRGNYQVMFTGNNAPTVVLQMYGWLVKGGYYTTGSRVLDATEPETVAGLAAAQAGINEAATAVSPAAVKAALLKANKAAYVVSNNIPITDRAVVSATRLPNNLLQATIPGEWLYLATNPLLSTQRGPAGTNNQRQ